ncbi:MAG: xanthine dehydrogenase family protein subunit M [Hyphomicrobiaceae bacterium]|nr:xanthine dehydrogenase family protein subunit M [Hyphomicrobiaceae bacterium]
MYAEFDLVVPETLAEALEAMAAGGSTLALAGGTNLIVDLRGRRVDPDRLVGLDRLAELRGIRANGGIELGARTTVTDLLRSADIAAAAPSLVESARSFAGQMVRNTATVAGNIACGSPAADLVPPLLVLDAEVTLASRTGTRTVALCDYYLGYKKDVRRPDELITAISLPRRPQRAYNRFYKLARRHGDAITVTGVAVTIAAEEGRCSLARIALAAVAPVPLRARRSEAMLEGKALTPALISEAAAQAAAESSPIDDVRASAGYRRKMVEVLTRRLLSEAWQSLH